MKNFILKNLYSVLGEKNNNQLRIIIFHDVLKKDEIKFQELIEYLKKNWNIISPNQFKQIITNKHLYDNNKKNILLTFDDGYKSQKLIAEKYLDPLNIKALFFIVSDFIKLKSIEDSHQFIKNNFFKTINNNCHLTSETYNMTTSDLLYLISKGHTIGGHTKTHAQLSKIQNQNTLTDEIINSTNELESKLNNYKIEDFAYTFGDLESINKGSTKMIIDNFKYLYSGLRGNNLNIRSRVLRRDAINFNEPFQVMSSYFNGYIDFLYSQRLIKLEKWTL